MLILNKSIVCTSTGCNNPAKSIVDETDLSADPPYEPKLGDIMAFRCEKYLKEDIEESHKVYAWEINLPK